MSLHPTSLVREPGYLRIVWNDGAIRRYRLRDLQDACPCANCREKRLAPPPDPFSLAVVGQGELAPLELLKMAPMGNYAYSLKFNHGCSRGIFTLESLRALGEPVVAENAS